MDRISTFLNADMTSSRKKSSKSKKSMQDHILPLLDVCRDMYGFIIRPEHVETYKAFAKIYEVEEEERSARWESFLSSCADPLNSEELGEPSSTTKSPQDKNSELSSIPAADLDPSQSSLVNSQYWGKVRPSLVPLERALSLRVEEQVKMRDMAIEEGGNMGGSLARTKSLSLANVEQYLQKELRRTKSVLPGVENGEASVTKEKDDKKEDTKAGSSEGSPVPVKSPGSSLPPKSPSKKAVSRASEDSGEAAKKPTAGLRRAVSGIPSLADSGSDGHGSELSSLRRSISGVPESGGGAVMAEVFDGAEETMGEGEEGPVSRELYSLVVGGVPMALRGELWQVFVGTKARRQEGAYDKLLEEDKEATGSTAASGSFEDIYARIRAKDAGQQHVNQIEKDLQRTFPGHPSLDDMGRDALRRVLIAYAKRKPDIGYCQGMNFLAALLLLLMPEENAFWTLTGLMDDYMEGYYSDQMIEAQVDQLVLEELVRNNFPRLVSHFDMLGVQVTWVTGPWFLSLFVNVLPWDSVLRVWDVMLYEGNRSMLFRTALALLEMHAGALMDIVDPGDLVSRLQSLASDWQSFDSSKLVLSACIGYVDVDEALLEASRASHRPSVLGMLKERQASLARYQSVRADRLAAEAKAAMATSASPSPSPTNTAAAAAAAAHVSPGATTPPGTASPEGAQKASVMAALQSHRNSLIRHQSMKAESLGKETEAAINAAATSVRSSASSAAASSSSFASLARLNSMGGGAGLVRQASAGKWGLMAAAGPGFPNPNPALNPNLNSSLGGWKGRSSSLLKQASASSYLLETAASLAAKNREEAEAGGGGGGGSSSSVSPREAAVAAIEAHRASLVKKQSRKSEKLGEEVREAMAALPSPDSAESTPTRGGSHGFGADKERKREGDSERRGKTAPGLGTIPESMGSGSRDGSDRFSENSAEISCQVARGEESAESEEGSEDVEAMMAQIEWLKEQLVLALEGQDVAAIREEEYQMALADLADRLEMAEEQDKRLLSAQVSELESTVFSLRHEVSELRLSLADARSQERSAVSSAVSEKEKELEVEVDDLLSCLAEKEEKMRKQMEDLQYLLKQKDAELENLVQVMMRMQNEQKTTEDLRLATERQVATQRQVIELLVEKNKDASERQSEWQQRALMAESTLQAFMAAGPAESPYSTFTSGRGGQSPGPLSSRSPWGHQGEEPKKRMTSEKNRMWSMLGYKEDNGNQTQNENIEPISSFMNRLMQADSSSAGSKIDLTQYGLSPASNEFGRYSQPNGSSIGSHHRSEGKGMQFANSPGGKAGWEINGVTPKASTGPIRSSREDSSAVRNRHNWESENTTSTQVSMKGPGEQRGGSILLHADEMHRDGRKTDGQWDNQENGHR